MEEKKIDVIIPAYKPDEQFKTLLNRLMKQTLSPNRIIILQTMVEGEPMLKPVDARVEVYPIQKKDFDHGATRDYGARMSEADYILFMTQDAMPKDKQEICKQVHFGSLISSDPNGLIFDTPYGICSTYSETLKYFTKFSCLALLDF